MSRQVEFEIESSRHATGAYWLPGAEYYAETVILILADDFDDEEFSDDQLLEFADDPNDERVSYKSAEVQP